MNEGSEIVKLFYEDREETMRIINTGGNLYTYLTGNKTFCPLIGTKITKGKFIGAGNYGQIFEIEFPGSKPKKYVVKKSKVYLDPCKRQTSYLRFDGRGETIIPKGSSICDMSITEYAISILAGEALRREKCINFIDVFAFSYCNNINTPGPLKNAQYTFMEQISSSVRKTISCMMENSLYQSKKMPLEMQQEIANSLFIQTLFAIYILQKDYHIVHGDLHDDNIFYVADPNYEWKGDKIGNYDYYEYKIEGKSLYLPAIPIIVKIGDFGLSVKYSKHGEPMIGDYTTLETGYDQQDGLGPWLPNFYSSSYDVTFVTFIFSNKNPKNKFIQDIAGWVADVPAKEVTSISVASARSKLIMKFTDRPLIRELEGKLAHVTPEGILTNKKLMGRYMKKPLKGSKILTLGESF